jgi:hypothetical protein
VSIGKINLLYMCASTEKVSILITVLQIHVIVNALFVTQFKTCLQFEVIWWDSSPVSASTEFLSAVVGRKCGASLRW